MEITVFKQTLRQYLGSRYSEKFIQQWFEPLYIQPVQAEIKSFEHNFNNAIGMQPELKSFRVNFPHHLFEQFFTMHGKKAFESAMRECFGNCVQIEYERKYQNKTPINPMPPFQLAHSQNKTSFNFSNFIGGNNHFVLDTAQAIARSIIEPTMFNPFSVWGKSGSGKTHILQALANENRNLKKSLVFSCNPRELADFYQAGETPHFTRQRILAHHVFIIDDLQQLENIDHSNAELQDELVLLCDHFFSAGKIVAFACTKAPEELENLIYPLKNRIQRGVCLELKQPDLEVRTEFVRQKAKSLNLPFSQKQILSLATQFKLLHKLEGIINKMHAYAFALGKNISDRDFEKMINKAGGINICEITSSRIMEVVAEQMRVSPADIIGTKRSKQITLARQLAMYLCRDLLNLSYPELGNVFGGKDQSTAMYSVKKIEQLHKVDSDTHKLVTNLKTKCLSFK